MTATRCRRATLPDIARMLDWAAEEGWNPGLDDAAAFHAADPEGFFVAEIAGEPVAAISVVNHSETFAFLGLYLCRPEQRGQGIGYTLWQHALAHAGNRTIGLDGVPEQEANYAKSGFILAGRTRRLTGSVRQEDLELPLAGPEDFAELARVDQAANGTSRDAFLREWLRESPSRKTVLLREGTELIGFATARLCRRDCKIGPVVAPDAAAAIMLTYHAAAAVSAPTVIVDVPDTSAAFGTMLRKVGFTEGFATARMYRGHAPRHIDDLHAVATLELG